MNAMRFLDSTYSYMFLSHLTVVIEMSLWRNAKSMELGVLMTLLTLFYHESDQKIKKQRVSQYKYQSSSCRWGCKANLVLVDSQMIFKKIGFNIIIESCYKTHFISKFIDNVMLGPVHVFTYFTENYTRVREVVYQER